MVDDPLSAKRLHEEEYFQRKDRELLEKVRQRAKAEQELRALGETVGVTDPEISRELADLGFTTETARLLPLVPLIEMAWAEGGVTASERKLVIDLARARGIAEGSAADRQLSDWLQNHPDETVFRRAGRLIGALFASGGHFQATPEDIIKYCETIAEASGGIFGIHKVSSDERATLGRIASEIKGRAK